MLGRGKRKKKGKMPNLVVTERMLMRWSGFH